VGVLGCYIRVSTKMQEDNDSIENQRLQGKLFAEKLGYSVIYFEDIESGANPDRDNWVLFKAAIDNKVIDAGTINKNDRLARDTVEAVLLYRKCAKINFPLWLAGAKMDYSDPNCFALFGIGAVLAETGRLLIVKNVLDAKAIAINDGRNTFRQFFGYDSKILAVNRGKVKREWYSVPEETEIIKMVYDWYLNKKMPLIKICQKLNESGYRTKNGKYWATRQIFHLLHHLEYTGLTVNKNGDRIPSKIYTDQIVTLEQYEEVQRKYPTQSTNTAIKKGRPAQYMGSGVLCCSYCGIGYFYHQLVGGYTQYIHNNNKKCSEQSRKILSKPIIDYILVKLYNQAMVAPQEIHTRLIIEGSQIVDDIGKEINRLKKLISEYDKKIERLFDAIEEGEDVKSRLQIRKSERLVLKKQLESLEESNNKEQERISKIQLKFAQGKMREFEQADEILKRTMLKEIITKLLIEGDKISAVLIDGREFVYNYQQEKVNQRQVSKIINKLNNNLNTNQDLEQIEAYRLKIMNLELLAKFDEDKEKEEAYRKLGKKILDVMISMDVTKINLLLNEIQKDLA